MGDRRTFSRRSVLRAGQRGLIDGLPRPMAFAEPPDLAAQADPLPGLVQDYQGQPATPA